MEREQAQDLPRAQEAEAQKEEPEQQIGETGFVEPRIVRVLEALGWGVLLLGGIGILFQGFDLAYTWSMQPRQWDAAQLDDFIAEIAAVLLIGCLFVALSTIIRLLSEIAWNTRPKH